MFSGAVLFVLQMGKASWQNLTILPIFRNCIEHHGKKKKTDGETIKT